MSLRWSAFVEATDAHGNPALDRRALEVCIFTHIAEALQAGDLCVPGSFAYADYRAQRLPWVECAERLHAYCEAVEIPVSGPALVAELRRQLSALADSVDQGFPANTQVTQNDECD